VEQGFFGQAVALEGDRLVVGAPRETGRTAKSGAVHVFEHDGSGWVEVARLIAPDGEPWDQFGVELALDGDRLAVGAYFDDVGSKDSGAVYVFDRGPNGWGLTLKQSPHDPSENQFFGAALDLAGSQLLVGAIGDDDSGTSGGAAYAYELDDSVVTYCQTAPNSVGDGARISSAGSVSLSQNDFHLAAEGLPPGKLGKFFYGPSSLQLPFGNGTLCVGGTVFRLDPVLATTLGNGFDWLDFTELPASSGAGQIAPGSTWNFQYWYRDPDAGGANLNLTNALRVTFCP
jgi:hypothetical protein